MSAQLHTPRPTGRIAALRRRLAREALERGQEDIARELEPDETPLDVLHAEPDDDQPEWRQ